MKTAIVTGAAQGVGFATSLLLAKAGYRVVMVDLQALDAPLAQLRAACGVVGAAAGVAAAGVAAAGVAAAGVAAAGAAAIGVSGDVSSAPFVENLAGRVAAEFGAADVLCNNAGVSLIARAEQTSLAQWQRVLDINLTGPFLLCKAIGAQMLSRRQGSIVNIASVAGLAGIAHRSAYNASKHGLIGLTRTLAAEWGGHGVRVNAVCPGWIKTEMDVADQGSGAYSDADIVDRVPMARFARAADVAAAVLYLADPERSGFVNGVSLPVDGGWMADGSWDSLRRKNR